MTQPSSLPVAGRHTSVQAITPFFEFDHLPAPQREVSAKVYLLAEQMLAALGDGPELTVGLRKLLEAKDAFVRASL